jgi:hypothetical protein
MKKAVPYWRERLFKGLVTQLVRYWAMRWLQVPATVAHTVVTSEAGQVLVNLLTAPLPPNTQPVVRTLPVPQRVLLAPPKAGQAHTSTTVPAKISPAPSAPRTEIDSPKNATANSSANATLSLSTGATRLTGPSLRARK